jgi:hypothetical protein
MTFLELFGYLASALIAISLMTANIKRLRWLNLAGAASFSAYGFLIEAYPVFILNAWISLVDIYFLWQLYSFRDQFDLVEETSADSPMYTLLLNRYGDDIRETFPAASDTLRRASRALLVFRNLKPVGLFAYETVEDGTVAEVILDYVIPEARDFKTAQFLFSQHARQLKDSNIHYLRAKSGNEIHRSYLKKMGFVAEGDDFQLVL